jgi:hypothetical protein
MSDVLLGVIVPAAVLGFAFLITWLLYRHFARTTGHK